MVKNKDTEVQEIAFLKKTNEELKKLLEYDKEVIEKKLIDKSRYLDQVKEEVDAYRKYKKTIDQHNDLIDKILSIRDIMLDITQERYPSLYKDFIQDIYDENPYEVLVFLRAFIREMFKEL